MRVLKISHSGLVTAWRERERCLIRRGIDVTMLTAGLWDEGGGLVRFNSGGDRFATPVRTWGTHPNVFVFDPRPIWKLLAQPADVLDIHEEPCSLATAEVLLLRMARRAKVPVVLYSAQNIKKRYPVPFRWIERWALRNAAAVSVCNSAAGRILVGKGLRGMVAEIPLGVDTARFTPAERQPPSDGRMNVGYVGRLARHKGVHVLIDSVAANPNLTLEVVGAGPAEEGLRQQVHQLAADSRIKWSGRAESSELPDKYRSFDVVVIPSLATASWEEQFCRVAAEAMACGVPLIAGRSGSLPEIVGDAGLLVAPGDPAELGRALTQLSTNPELWQDLRGSALQRADLFRWESIAEDYRRLYEMVIGKASERTARLSPSFLAPGETAPAPIDVIIVAYGDSSLLATCLDALGSAFAVTVVDNSSSASTRAAAEGRGAHYIDPRRNIGFAAGVNLALRERRKGADVLLLNPDATIGAADVAGLQRMLYLDASLACVAPNQADPADGSPQRVGWPIPSPSGAWIEAIGLRTTRDRTDFLIGSILLLRGSAIDDIGLFDERFFLYSEETDWQMRAMRHGWTTSLCREISATHIGAGTGGEPSRRETHFHASTEKLIRKHYGPTGWTLFRAGSILGAGARSLLLSGTRARAARFRLSLYWRGPCKAEAALAESTDPIPLHNDWGAGS